MPVYQGAVGLDRSTMLTEGSGSPTIVRMNAVMVRAAETRGIGLGTSARSPSVVMANRGLVSSHTEP